MDIGQALTVAGPSAAVSHEVAARTWGIELVEDGPQRLTVPRNRGRLQIPGWEVVRSDLSGGEVEEINGVRTTTPLRTVLDLCRVLVLAHAVVAADSALRLTLFSTETLLGALTTARGRGAACPRRVAPAVDATSGSVLETLLRLVLRDAGLEPVPQFVVLDARGRFLARVDFCWPACRLIVEADGFAYHSDRAAYRRDRERLNDLERCGWRVLRFTWEDVLHWPEHVVAVVHECLAQQAA